MRAGLTASSMGLIASNATGKQARFGCEMKRMQTSGCVEIANCLRERGEGYPMPGHGFCISAADRPGERGRRSLSDRILDTPLCCDRIQARFRGEMKRMQTSGRVEIANGLRKCAKRCPMPGHCFCISPADRPGERSRRSLSDRILSTPFPRGEGGDACRSDRFRHGFDRFPHDG